MDKLDYKQYYNSNDSVRLFLYALIIPYVAMFLLYGVYMIIGTSINMNTTEFMEQLPVIMVNSIFMQVCFVVIFFAFNYKRKINFVSATKLNKVPNAWAIAVAICLGFAFMWFSSPLMTLFEKALTAIGFNIDSTLGFELTNAGTIIFAIIGLGIIPAFIEEFIFRGAILQGLRKHGDWFAIIASALLFMLMHANIQQTIYQFAFGVLAGWLVVKTGSIWTSIAIHGLNNIVVIIVQAVNEINGTATQTVELNTEFWVQFAIYTVVLVALVCLGVYLIKHIYKNDKTALASQTQAQTSDKSKISKTNSKFPDMAEDGSRAMHFKAGFVDFMQDRTLKREGVIGIFISLVFLIINSTAMLM